MHDRLGNDSWIAFMTISILQDAQPAQPAKCVTRRCLARCIALHEARQCARRRTAARLFGGRLTIGGTFSIVFANP